VVRGTAVDAATDTVKALVEEIAETPPGAVASEAVEVVDVEVAVAVGSAFFRGVHLVKPVVGDNLAGSVIDEAGVGVRGVGVGCDAPVGATDVFFDGQLAVNVSVASVDSTDLFALHFVKEAVCDEGSGGVEVTTFEERTFDMVLDLFDGDGLHVMNGCENSFIDEVVIVRGGAMEGFAESFLDLISLEGLGFAIAFDNLSDHITCAWKMGCECHPAHVLNEGPRKTRA
jgi:hypothetical protein